MNSNYTLRFPRTYREATGSDCHFSRADRMDRMVLIACSIMAAFVVGMMIGGWL